MAVRQPMVSDPRNIAIYGTMDIIEAGMVSGKEKRVRRATADFESCVSKMKNFVHDPTVCRRFLDITFDHFPSHGNDVATRMIDTVDRRDTSVMLYLVDKLMDLGNMGLASTVFGNLSPGQDLAMMEYVMGRFDHSVGNMESAAQHLTRAVLTDPNLYAAYDLLDGLDPSYGWLHMANIARLIVGEPPVMSDGLVSGDREELFLICEQWSKGDVKGAMAAIRRAHHFIRDDPFALSLYAKMSASMGSYRDAIESYTKALETLRDSESISVELAATYRAIGDYDGSTAVLRRVKVYDPNSIRVLAPEYMSLIDDGRRQDAEWTLGALMSAPGLDAEVMLRCIEVLRAHDMSLEASNLTKRVSSRCVDRSFGKYLLALESMASKDYRGAISHANSALRSNRYFTRARCLRAKAYLETDGVTKAMQDVNRMLDESPDDMMVLDVKKDIHIAIGHYDDALQLCDYMLSIDPRDVDVIVDRAVVLGHKGDVAGSLDSYREALNIRADVKLFTSILLNLLAQRRVSDLCRLVDDFDDVFGRSVMMWRLRGNAEYLAGMYDEASDSYRRAVDLSPNEGEIWHSKGLAEEAAERYADAEASFGRALLVDLDNGEYWISMATVQEKRGNVKGAIASLNKVITTANNGVFPLVMKARLLAKCGRVRESLYFLDQAQRIDPSNVGVMRMSKDALMHLEEYDKAIELCQRIINITGCDQVATIDLVSAYLANGRRDSASERLEKLMATGGLSSDTLSKCAVAYHQLGEFDKEVKALELLLDIEPDDRSVMMRLAEAYAVSGNKGLASEMYDRLEEGDPEDLSITVKKVMLDVDSGGHDGDEFDSVVEDPEIMLELAHKALESGREDEALHIYNNVIDICPDCADAHVAVLELMMKGDRIVDAIAMSSDSRHLFPNDPRILKIMGDAFMSADDPARAVDAFTDAMKMGMDTAELYGSTGLALESVGMMRMALDNYRLASEKDPYNLEYRLNIAALEMKVGHDDEAEAVLNTVLVVDHRNIRALRMFATICSHKNDSEALLALFDDIMSVAIEDDDIRFFENILRELGETGKADQIGAKLLF